MTDTRIKSVKGFEIIDSRGNPTVMAEVELACGAVGTASVPSGASTGVHEAHELRDGDKTRYGGKGARGAADNVSGALARAAAGMDSADQTALDERMNEIDGSRNKANMGANAILGVSLASAKAYAAAVGIPLWKRISELSGQKPAMPVPMMNILNGGAHARNNVDIQEFMIIPYGARSFDEGLERCVRIYNSLGRLLDDREFATGVGDEGGYAPNLGSDEDAIKMILQASERAGCRPGEDVVLAIDAAASGWLIEGGVYMPPKSGRPMSGDQLIARWSKLVHSYPIVSLEDAAAEDDWQSWGKLTLALGKQLQLVGDDLFVTNKKRLLRGIEEKCANAILIKPNQIGTLTETLAAMELARSAGYASVVSHRSGETPDDFIADLAVGTGCGQIKAGAPCRGERTAKYNRLLRIEREL